MSERDRIIEERVGNTRSAIKRNLRRGAIAPVDFLIYNNSLTQDNMTYESDNHRHVMIVASQALLHMLHYTVVFQTADLQMCDRKAFQTMVQSGYSFGDGCPASPRHVPDLIEIGRWNGGVACLLPAPARTPALDCHPTMPASDSEEDFLLAMFLEDVINEEDEALEAEDEEDQLAAALNPHEGTAWQALYHSHNNSAYITTMSFDVHTFNLLLSSGFATCWSSQTIPHPDVQQTGNPCPGHQSPDADGALGLLLHWLSSTMCEVSLQQIFALVPNTVNHYLYAAIDVLLETVMEMPEGKIMWPEDINEFHCYELLIMA
ncbi:hypothetical protein WOLCODRAFT_19383 [Wolfiporia cocos MD-104 SS10]|uniref:Uncharacterized protein n=1 Tax=Wolfiporia cocos (strain MD-104) TaxID=742152 RepID=A0A2H3JSL0_WOLCO|nr:hypothetical protein WOLCODRAFT_19383 [Wolfiporia cocos MD-104 SS10]